MRSISAGGGCRKAGFAPGKPPDDRLQPPPPDLPFRRSVAAQPPSAAKVVTLSHHRQVYRLFPSFPMERPAPPAVPPTRR